MDSGGNVVILNRSPIIIAQPTPTVPVIPNEIRKTSLFKNVHCMDFRAVFGDLIAGMLTKCKDMF